jgi:hypothetical protein
MSALDDMEIAIKLLHDYKAGDTLVLEFRQLLEYKQQIKALFLELIGDSTTCVQVSELKEKINNL